MPCTTVDRLIINSPYEEPRHHWRYDREARAFELVAGRRPVGYVMASGDSRAFDAPASSWRFRWSTRYARVSGLARGRLSRRY